MLVLTSMVPWALVLQAAEAIKSMLSSDALVGGYTAACLGCRCSSSRALCCRFSWCQRRQQQPARSFDAAVCSPVGPTS